MIGTRNKLDYDNMNYDDVLSLCETKLAQLRFHTLMFRVVGNCMICVKIVVLLLTLCAWLVSTSKEVQWWELLIAHHSFPEYFTLKRSLLCVTIFILWERDAVQGISYDLFENRFVISALSVGDIVISPLERMRMSQTKEKRNRWRWVYGRN